MKILVTGSSGHLGEALVRTLRTMNYKVTGSDISPSPFTDSVGSIADREFVKQIMEGVTIVLHPATLHKPHVATHNKHDFVDVNITGTLNLLEEAVLANVQSFVFTSTTSTFGAALSPEANKPAAWITEKVQPIPKNIYGITKTAAEDLCFLFYKKYKLPCMVLRTSRFFAEADDDALIRGAYEDANVKANELLYRRVDIADVVSAHVRAMEEAADIGFGTYIISATTPFTTADLQELHTNAPAVVKRLFPEYEALYKARGWKMFPEIGRVYVNAKAVKALDWRPYYSFNYALDCLQEGRDFRSPLSLEVGSKGYHTGTFDEGPYPV
jgi:UDP-glucose 4-epimerase